MGFNDKNDRLATSVGTMIVRLPLFANVGKGFFVVIVNLSEQIYSISPVVQAPSIIDSTFGFKKLLGSIVTFCVAVPVPI